VTRGQSAFAGALASLIYAGKTTGAFSCFYTWASLRRI